MADTVTWSLLRELASFRTEKGCATSLYLNLDPSEVPTERDAQTRMNALLSSAEKTDRKDLTHEQRLALRADFERIANWFDNEFERVCHRMARLCRDLVVKQGRVPQRAECLYARFPSFGD